MGPAQSRWAVLCYFQLMEHVCESPRRSCIVVFLAGGKSFPVCKVVQKVLLHLDFQNDFEFKLNCSEILMNKHHRFLSGKFGVS